MGAARYRLFALAALLAHAAESRAAEGAPASVAFHGAEGRAELLVRGGTSATVERPSPTLAVVRVAGAKAPRRIDRLPLDTTAFRGPVARVEVKGSAGGLDVRVHLAKGATIATRASEGAIAIDVVGAASESSGGSHDE